MPNILVRIPEGTLPPAAQAELVAGINRVAADVEQIPDEPARRAMCWVLIEEITSGGWTCGGADMTARMLPVMVQVLVPAGVVDPAGRQRYAKGIQEALTRAFEGEPRKLAVSCVIQDVDDGYWGVNGDIWNLRVFARQVGYGHLQHLAS